MTQIIEKGPAEGYHSSMMKAAMTIVVWFGVTIFLPSPGSAACTVCHSKNPKMVRMHEALGFKDCFMCHGPGKKKSSAERKEQMSTDPLCNSCHKS
jgi:hypothetical protein